MTRMIEAERLMIVAAIALAASGVSCATNDAGQPASPRRAKTSGNAVFNASQQRAGRAEAQVSLLARAFLPPATEAHPGFAYYAYLLFTDSSPASAPARRAASAFYLGMLSHVHAANEKTGVRREDMAVLYVPVTDKAAADSLIGERDQQALIAAYDYVRARGMVRELKRAGKAIPKVAIIGGPRPLTAGVALGTMDVVDLTDPGTVAERMERFRDSLEAGERHVNEGGQPVVLKRLREYFAWAGTAGRDGSTLLTF
jgi:hypothetical protein